MEQQEQQIQHVVPVTRDEYDELQQRMMDTDYVNKKLLDRIIMLDQKLDDMTAERDSLVILYNALYSQKRIPTLMSRITRFFAPLRNR